MVNRLRTGSLLSRAGILLLGSVLATVLTLNALVFYHNTRVLVDNEHLVSHTQIVLATLDTAAGQVAEAQNGLRAYLFAGDPEELRRCRRAVGDAAAAITAVAHLTADQPAQLRRILTLRRVLPATIPGDLLPDGLPVEYANLSQTRGPALGIATRLDHVQAVITTMKTTEVGLLDRRTNAARLAASGTYVTLAVATIADLVLLAGFLLVVLRTLRRRAERVRAQADVLRREQAARADAEAAVTTRDVFLSLASHELRTPLTAVLGHAQLLQYRLEKVQGVSDKDMHQLQALTRGARHLSALVEQLLDVSRLQRGQLELTQAPLDLVEVIRRTVENVQHSAPHHHIVMIPIDGPVIVMGDEVRLEQAVGNLLTNAIKFSPDADTVRVEVMRDDRTARVAVTDYGVGIPAGEQARLFEQFYRVPNPALTAVAGLGVGLFVVHEIVTRHGGTVQVKSSEGHGSTFTIDVPLLLDPLPSHAAPARGRLGSVPS